MPAKRSRAPNAKTKPTAPGVERLREIFLEQIRARGRVHQRAVLAAMRECLEHPATEHMQEIALLLGRKLRLRPQKVKDIAAVRRALTGEPDTREASG